MKKKTTIRILSTLFLSISLGVVACGGNGGQQGHTHTFSSEWSYDETYHWHDATCGHDVVSDKAEHDFKETTINPTYEAKGYTLHECKVCDYSYKDNYVDELEHHYSPDWSSDGYSHWHACTDEGYENLKGSFSDHNYGEWIIDSEASESQDGHRHKICQTCGYRFDENYAYNPVKVERVYLPNPNVDLFNGYTYSIRPTVVPNNANKNIKYDVEKPALLNVSNNVATASGAGNTLVFAYNDDDNDNVRDNDEPYAVMAFAITEPDPSKSVTVDSEITIKVDESKKLTYSSNNIDAYGMEYGFYSDDESICTISAGTVKGHKAGTTRVSVSLQGYRAYCNVTVVDNQDDKGIRASAVKSSDNLLMNKGESKTLSYQILPDNAVDKLASVTSNNSSVVKVNADKSITAVKGGTATITLTTENGKFTRVLVTVKDQANTQGSYYNNYYGNLTWENGEDLKAKLHNIISKDVKALKYDTPNWETNQVADQDLYDYAYVNGVYNDTPIDKTATQTGWQREHAFAASLMTGFSTGSAVKALGRATDFHNLLAASAGANSSRGNKNLGYVNPDSAELTSKENCLFTRNAFEPNDVDKGRLARAIFYMSVMYNEEVGVDVTETWTYKGDDATTHSGSTKSVHVNSKEQALEIVDGYVDYNRISINEFMYPTKAANETYVEYFRDLIRQEQPNLETSNYDTFRELAYERYLTTSMPYSIGYFTDLLKWNSLAVDHQEVQHNESVYSYNCTAGNGKQGNRNPFVDYPQLVDYIYGDLKDVPGSLADLTPTYLALEMDKDEIHHYSVNSATLAAFKSGTKPTVDDFKLKAIKNDLSEGTLDKSKIHVEDYTFTDDDVLTGKVITITTDKNTLQVPVKVTSDSVLTFDNCKFSYAPSAGNRSAYVGSGTTWVATFDGVKFDVTFGTATSLFQNLGTGGVTAGSKNNPITSFTIETQQSYTDVNAAFALASASQDMTINYAIYVNDIQKLSGTISGSTPQIIGGTFEECTGKVKIVFTGVNGIKFAGIAFNYA